MCGGDDVGASMVNTGVNGKSCAVERMPAFDDFSFCVDEHQVGDANLAEVHAERVQHFLASPWKGDMHPLEGLGAS